MEDNEFEEVTIISHTDLCSSVLDESKVGDLLKQTKLEVTQTVSATANTKASDIKDSDKSTLLDSIYRDVLVARDPELRTNQEGWMALCRLRGQGSGLLMSSSPHLFVANPQSIARLATGLFRVHFIQEWGDNLLCFSYGAEPKVVTKVGVSVKAKFSYKFGGSLNSGVSSSPSFCYFWDMKYRIVRLDSKLDEKVVSSPERVKHFQVCWLTQLLVFIDENGILSRGTISRNMELHSEGDDEEYYLKQLHSGDFLVSATSTNAQKMQLQMVRGRTLEKGSQLELACECPYVPQSMNLLKPSRTGTQLLIVYGTKTLHLIAVVGQRIHQAAELDLGQPESINCIAYESNHTWVIGSPDNSWTSVRVCLHPRLRI